MSETAELQNRIEELEKRIRRLEDTVRELAARVNYAVYKIRKTLEAEQLIDYEDSYDLRRLGEEFKDLQEKLEPDLERWDC